MRSVKNRGTDTLIINDFSCNKASLGSAWKSPFPLTVHKDIISCPKKDSWARRIANLVNFFFCTNIGYFSTTDSGEINLDLSIGGRSCITCSGQVDGMFLPLPEIDGVFLSLLEMDVVFSPLFVMSLNIGIDDGIGVAVADIDDIGVTDPPVGVSAGESGWLIVGSALPPYQGVW